MDELHPDVNFKMSNRWFQAFKSRYNISLRRPTHTAQKNPEEFRVIVQQFHRYLRQTAALKEEELKDKQIGLLGPWELSDIANMDQTPLKFCFNTKGSTYNNTGEKTVWCRTSGSGHEKRQCTVQLTIFADGVSHVKSLIILKGTGQRIALNERKQYDGHVAVQFQENAWCDESMMLYWV